MWRALACLARHLQPISLDRLIQGLDDVEKRSRASLPDPKKLNDRPTGSFSPRPIRGRARWESSETGGPLPSFVVWHR